MSILTKLSGGLRALFRKRQAEQDMDEELRDFLAASAERKMRDGMSREEALRAARVEMGSMEYVKDEIRGAGWESGLQAFWSDIRYALRVLRKTPVFTVVVVLTLGLGIGANTAIFGLIDAILLRSLPVAHPEELVRVNNDLFTNPLWEELRQRQDVFSGVFAWGTERLNLNSGGLVRYARGIWVSGDYFRTLGMRPALGRLLTNDDDKRGCAATAVLSYAFWQSNYGGAPGVVGSTIALATHPFEIVGVAPDGFYGMEVGQKFDVAVPICATAVIDGADSRLDKRSWWWLESVGRVKPGLGMAQVQSRLAALSPSIFGAVVPQNWDAQSQDGFRKRVLKTTAAGAGLSVLRKPYEEPLRILMAIVGLVLLIACANIASLLMARAAARGKEMAMRQALGASRWRLVRQVITESMLLSGAGALVGLVLARWGNDFLLHYLSTVQEKVFLDLSVDGRILAFTIAMAVLTGLLFGAVPALRGSRVSLTSALKETKATSRGRSRFRLWLLASQVALSLVLLITAGLLLHSFWNLSRLDIGFDRDHILLARVTPGATGVPASQLDQTYGEIETRLRALPGVTAVARSTMTPLGHMTWNTNIQADAPNAPVGDDGLAWFNFVGPGYFATMHSPLLAGRDFGPRDTAKSARVAVINQTLALRFFPGLNPVGRTFRQEGDGRKLEPPVEVVGVVKDAKYETMHEKTLPEVFLPVSQLSDPLPATFEIRTALPMSSMVAGIQKSVNAASKSATIEVHSMAAQVDDAMSRERLLAALSAFFGGVALLLAMIGLYGTLSYLVAQRRVEFGIRMALGASSRSILGLVMNEVLLLVLGGVAAGIALSLATTRLLQTMLFGLAPRDPGTMAVGALLLTAVSLAASMLAARRAAKVDPMVALRQD